MQALIRLFWRKQDGTGHRIGKTAADTNALASQARKYVRSRTNENGGWGEAGQGLRHKTLPFIFGIESSISFGSLVVLGLQICVLFGAALLPIISRKAMRCDQGAAEGLPWLFQTMHHLSPTDYALGLGGILFIGLPKLIDNFWRKRPKARVDSQYRHLSAALEKMPPVNDDEEPHSLQVALTHALNALKIEMSELIGDKEGATEVVLLQYCDDAGEQMQVTARTAVDEQTHRPRDAALFLANYVAREGQWFAEHDFLSKRNPFNATRLTVPGAKPMDYRSVLFLPILMAIREPVDSRIGVQERVVDCCVGVICIHSRKAFRFWRWGDHNKQRGGFGDVAYGRALPYIALISKLVDGRCKVRTEVL